jgi:hypothetical protein
MPICKPPVMENNHNSLSDFNNEEVLQQIADTLKKIQTQQTIILEN